MVADFSQADQGGENRGGIAIAFFDDVGDGSAGFVGFAEASVERGLFGRERAEDVAFDLRREIFGDVCFQTAQHEREDFFAQAFGGIFSVSELLFGFRAAGLHQHDRFFELLRKMGLAAEESGHQKIEERPQFRESVLDRRAGQREAVHGRNCLHGFGDAGGGVFDEVRFVDNDVAPSDFAQERDVVADGAECGDDDVVALTHTPHLRPRSCWSRKGRGGNGGVDFSAEAIAFLGRAAVDHDAHLGAEFFEFGAPVVSEAGGRDDQRGHEAELVAHTGELRDRLCGFAEAHVVGEDAVEAVAPPPRPRKASHSKPFC